MDMTSKIVLEGLDFGEGPRWRDGHLYFSDFYRGGVYRCDVDAGTEERLFDVPTQPSGLGWLPDGRMLVVSMIDRKVLRREADGTLVEHADLGGIATFHANDMLVDATGRAYVGNFGFDLHAMLGEHDIPTALGIVHASPGKYAARLALVQPDGRVSPAGDPCLFPNGMVLLDGGETLVVAETVALRLQAYDVAEDGSLSNGRTWAQFEDAAPDGICVAPDGRSILIATAMHPEIRQVAEGGEVLATHAVSQVAYAVQTDGARIFVMTAPDSHPREVDGKGLAKIEMIEP
jgi:sugar lactone lactonase YvrE